MMLRATNPVQEKLSVFSLHRWPLIDDQNRFFSLPFLRIVFQEPSDSARAETKN